MIQPILEKMAYALQSLYTELGLKSMPDPSIVQVDLVCHGKTEVFPDRDGSDPYAVSAQCLTNRGSFTFFTTFTHCPFPAHYSFQAHTSSVG